MRATITASGGADPAVAWARYEHLDLWSTWSPQIQEVIAATQRISPGLNGLVVGPLGVRVPFEVLTVDAEAMEWTWHVRLGPVHATLDHVVRPSPSSATGPSRPSPCGVSSGATSSPRDLQPATFLAARSPPRGSLAGRR